MVEGSAPLDEPLGRARSLRGDACLCALATVQLEAHVLDIRDRRLVDLLVDAVLELGGQGAPHLLNLLQELQGRGLQLALGVERTRQRRIPTALALHHSQISGVGEAARTRTTFALHRGRARS
eukprot:4476324-Prymnesium_polylepis.1